MAIPGVRTRGTIPLKGSSVLFSSIPRKFLPKIVLSDILFVATVYGCRHWLLEYDTGVFWVVMRILACSGLAAVWQILTGRVMLKADTDVKWSVLGAASVLLLVQQLCLFAALNIPSPARVILFARFAPMWFQTLSQPPSIFSSACVGLAFLLSIASDISLSPHRLADTVPMYGALALHAIASDALERTNNISIPKLGYELTMAANLLGASVLALPLYLIRTIMLGFPESPGPSLAGLAILPLTTFSVLFLAPTTSRTLNNITATPRPLAMSHPIIGVSLVIIVTCMFQQIGWTDAFVAALLFLGVRQPQSGLPWTTVSPETIRAYLQTILSNSESRKIFYFLLLNMSYMLVQMIYGVWTNSLGLISDAIHMAFDCIAIAVGLFASVMATWPPNERFTYGYGRIETLSGFANGVFLILISIFIVIEAIQRLLEPPDMNTSRLLLVSSIGLAINLFGMFAMGGHHHHHHGSHTHAHSHSHSQEHSHSSGTAGSHTPTIQGSDRVGHDCTPNQAPAESLQPHPPTVGHLSSRHSHTQTLPPEAPAQGATSKDEIERGDSGRKRRFEGPSLQLQASHRTLSDGTLSAVSPNYPVPSSLLSPVTPGYEFGKDLHYQTHHALVRAPNLHDHSHTCNRSHEGHSHNMRGVFLHVMADTLGSVGVIVSTLLIQRYGWTGFDPMASILIAILILSSIIPLVMDTGRILCLDVGSRQEHIQAALDELFSVEGLASYTLPRFWPKDASSLIGSIHIQLAPSPVLSPSQEPTFGYVDRVVERVDALLRDRISGLEELTIQVEEIAPRAT